MKNARTENSGYGGLSAVDRCVRAPAPTKGLTFRKGKREANVHDVRDGIQRHWGISKAKEEGARTSEGEILHSA